MYLSTQRHLSTLQAIPRDIACKTRGQDGFAAFLSCRALSSTTTCRFIPALFGLPTIRPESGRLVAGRNSPEARFWTAAHMCDKTGRLVAGTMDIQHLRSFTHPTSGVQSRRGGKSPCDYW